jgi:hypothetical protein
MTTVTVDHAPLDAAQRPASYLPGPVIEALRLVAVPESVVPDQPVDAEIVPREISDARLLVHQLVMADHRVGDLPQPWIDEELRLLEAVERAKAWLDFQGLAALRRLREAMGELVRDRDDSVCMSTGRGLSETALAHESDAATVDEAMLATGLSQFEVTRRLELAQDEDGRGGGLLGALARGDVGLERALRIHHDTRDLGWDQARAVAARLLTRNADGSIRSGRAVRRELRRQVALHVARSAEARAAAVEDRTSYAVLEHDGTGTMVITGEAGRVTAAAERVDGLARRLRADGDRRTLEQLRSDVALDLVLFGWASPDRVPEAAQSTFVGTAPVAHVNVVVGLATLLGLDDGIGEVPGYGYLSGEHARQLCLARGSVWRRIVTDPATGTALELSTGRYRPTAAMADQVAAFDQVCRSPGCVVPAHQCDIDHQRAWPAGPTTVANLSAKHRRHHNHKTRGVWTAEAEVGGGIVWRTASGRRYRTDRHDYDDPLGRPVSDTEIERALAEDPPPF